MRHLKSGRKLGRTASHRKATLANLATALLEHKSIVTTTPKAKEARATVERLITFAKKGDIASRRQVLRTIRDKNLVKNLYEKIAPKYAERNGGYTRIIKIGNRKGDNARLAIFELVGYENIKAEKIEKQRLKREAKESKKQKDIEEQEESPSEE
ncbi:50S ribosomal protein L17 [candidate division KSB1 bacterium]|nr:50S ribosomal protein L17 [candidate division KSB1 bacterium]